MPAALPALLLGKDSAIYEVNNSGRPYKIGYISGVNLCGLVFLASDSGNFEGAKLDVVGLGLTGGCAQCSKLKYTGRT